MYQPTCVGAAFVTRKPVRCAALLAAACLSFSALHGATARAQETVEEAAEQAAEKAAVKTAEKVQATVENAAAKAVEKAATKAAEKAVQKATEDAAAQSALTAVRPDEKKGPTEIRFFVFLVDVDAIDDANQNFTVNVFLRLEWRDERLADPASPVRKIKLENVWNPQVLVSNQQGRLAKSLAEIVEVDPDGTVRYRQRFTGELSQPLDLSEFPEDRQQFTIQFVSVANDSDRLMFVPMRAAADPSILGGSIAGTFSLPDWKILSHEALAMPFEPVAGVEIPGFALRFEAERYLEYYIWQVIVPLTVVVIMSWAAFWISGRDASVRVGVATSSILTLVALRFVVASLLPRLPYMTRMDYFTVGSTVLVFLALVVVVLTSFLTARKREKSAYRIDLTARAAFPAAFLALLGWFFAG